MNIFRRTNRVKTALLALAIGVTSTMGGGVVFAQTEANTSTVTRAAEERKQQAEERKQAAQEKAAEAKAKAQAKVEEAKQRLEGQKLKACEAREKRIAATMEQMAKRGENHVAVFTKITDRVKAFYAEKGKTVDNYDALVATVDAKKAAAEQAVASAQSVGGVFSCDSDSPKIASDQFRAAHQSQVAALKEYRTAVKELIVAVKSAQAQTVSAERATNE